MEKIISILTAGLILTLTLTAFPAFGEESTKSKVVNINEAEATQIAYLPRVGPSLSARIVEFRKENGKFKQPADLLLVRGIGEKTFQLMEPFITVSGPTTLDEKLRVSELQQNAAKNE